jgi:hypothetical protein
MLKGVQMRPGVGLLARPLVGEALRGERTAESGELTLQHCRIDIEADRHAQPREGIEHARRLHRAAMMAEQCSLRHRLRTQPA